MSSVSTRPRDTSVGLENDDDDDDEAAVPMKFAYEEPDADFPPEIRPNGLVSRKEPKIRPANVSHESNDASTGRSSPAFTTKETSQSVVLIIVYFFHPL